MSGQRILKICTAVLMIALSGLLAAWLNDSFNRKNPLAAIPDLEITAENASFPAAVLGYDWSFVFGGNSAARTDSLNELALTPNHLDGGEALQLNFTQEPVAVSVQQSGAYSYEFSELAGAPLFAPSVPGGYIYMVHAEFERGIADYYFYLVVG